jgi:hypothetical protein
LNVSKKNQNVDLRETALDTHEYPANEFSEGSIAALAASANLNLDFNFDFQASRPENLIDGSKFGHSTAICIIFFPSLCCLVL